MRSPWQGQHPNGCECPGETYDIAAHRPARGPTRAPARAGGLSERGAPCHASSLGARARSRPPAQPVDGGKHGADRHRQPSDCLAHLCD